MKRVAFIAALLFGLICSATAGWQSRDSNYNSSVAGPSSPYSGPGDVAGTAAKAWYGLRAYSNAKAGTKIANICNSGDANCADVNSLANGNFDVATAQGAPLNCGGAGGTCTIKTLYDQSGATYCAGATACDVTNATIANRPTLAFNCINTSLPCMVGNGSQSLTSTTNIPANVSAYTASFVAQRTTGTTSQGIMTMSGNITWRFQAVANAIEEYNGSPLLGATVSDATFHSFQGIINGASSEWFIDNVSTTGTVGNVGVSAAAMVLFNDTFSGALLNGKAAEVGFWIVSLHSVETTMCNNQRLYWGTPGAC